MTNEAEAKIELGVIPDAREVFGRRYQKFSQLVGEFKAAQEVKRQAEAEAKRIDKLLQEFWTDCQAKTVMDDKLKVTLVQSSNSHISKERLIELGVAATVIRDATKTVYYSFVKVTEGK